MHVAPCDLLLVKPDSFGLPDAAADGVAQHPPHAPPAKEVPMKTLRSIVVGLDFSDCSRVALGHAQQPWRHGRARRCTPCTSSRPAWTIRATNRGHGDAAGDSPSTGRKKARSRWEAFSIATPGASGLPLEVCFGSRLAGIRRQPAAHAADLLSAGRVSGNRPNTGMGTVASGCIRGVPTDVLVVRDNYREPFQTIAVGIDFLRRTASLPLESAAFVAHHERARLHAVHVAAGNVETYAGLRGELALQLQEFVSKATDRYPGLDVRCRLRVPVFRLPIRHPGVCRWSMQT